MYSKFKHSVLVSFRPAPASCRIWSCLVMRSSVVSAHCPTSLLLCCTPLCEVSYLSLTSSRQALSRRGLGIAELRSAAMSREGEDGTSQISAAPQPLLYNAFRVQSVDRLHPSLPCKDTGVAPVWRSIHPLRLSSSSGSELLRRAHRSPLRPPTQAVLYAVGSCS